MPRVSFSLLGLLVSRHRFFAYYSGHDFSSDQQFHLHYWPLRSDINVQRIKRAFYGRSRNLEDQVIFLFAAPLRRFSMEGGSWVGKRNSFSELDLQTSYLIDMMNLNNCATSHRETKKDSIFCPIIDLGSKSNKNCSTYVRNVVVKIASHPSDFFKSSHFLH